MPEQGGPWKRRLIVIDFFISRIIHTIFETGTTHYRPSSPELKQRPYAGMCNPRLDAGFWSVEPAEGVWCPASGLAVNTSLWARARLPVAHGPESGHHTPSATIVLVRTTQMATLFVLPELGVGIYCQDRERQGCRARVPREGFTTCPGNGYPPPAPHPNRSNGTAIKELTLVSSKGLSLQNRVFESRMVKHIGHLCVCEKGVPEFSSN